MKAKTAGNLNLTTKKTSIPLRQIKNDVQAFKRVDSAWTTGQKSSDDRRLRGSVYECHRKIDGSDDEVRVVISMLHIAVPRNPEVEGAALAAWERVVSTAAETWPRSSAA